MGRLANSGGGSLGDESRDSPRLTLLLLLLLLLLFRSLFGGSTGANSFSPHTGAFTGCGQASKVVDGVPGVSVPALALTEVAIVDNDVSEARESPEYL